MPKKCIELSPAQESRKPRNMGFQRRNVPEFKRRSLTKAKKPNDQFQRDEAIGHSSYGIVYGGFHNVSKERVVIKIYDENKGNLAITRQVAIEVSSLRNVHGSRYIANLLDYKVSERGVHEVVIT
ncbi:hypothetical protein Pyn_30980 [Prunus yedoensis var. nudiflora]|uniref:Protein kinase domain-containing protein n=1 Tax=Prunus yedoensis var. nudiflora TaxID=2094558 RepID=A0A315AK42_PRUYE|nr:hypothetical protein Pyn_30980 [Prunus yedoensis var. nudiflora]